MTDEQFQDLVARLNASNTSNWARDLSESAFRLGVEQERKRCVGMPTIVCLCGSTRFKAAFDDANYKETMAGKIVLSVGFYMHASGNRHGDGVGCDDQQKIALDVLHKRKIDLADEVLVLNVGGYIGESTRSEIAYASALGKPIRYLECARAIEGGGSC